MDGYLPVTQAASPALPAVIVSAESPVSFMAPLSTETMTVIITANERTDVTALANWSSFLDARARRVTSRDQSAGDWPRGATR